MDKYFGCIHAMALGLVHLGYAEDAMSLGEAHEALQNYVIAIERQRDELAEFIRKIFGPKYDAEIALILQGTGQRAAAGTTIDHDPSTCWHCQNEGKVIRTQPN